MFLALKEEYIISGTMDSKKLIGNRIKSLRRSRGYSQERLAEIVGINSKYLSSIERGEENPTLDLFLRLAQGLKVSIDQLFRTELEGQGSKELRRQLTRLIPQLKDEQLRQVVRILEALAP